MEARAMWHRGRSKIRGHRGREWRKKDVKNGVMTCELKEGKKKLTFISVTAFVNFLFMNRFVRTLGYPALRNKGFLSYCP